MKLLLEELHAVATDWRMLMTELGLELWQLKKIDDDCQATREKLASALDVWLCLEKDPSWANIISALQRMGKEELAKTIETRYCQLNEGSTVYTCCLKSYTCYGDMHINTLYIYYYTVRFMYRNNRDLLLFTHPLFRATMKLF